MKISWSKADGHQLDGWPYTKHHKVCQVKRKLIGYRWYSSCGLRWLVAPEMLASPSPLSCDKDAPSKPQVSISTIQLPDSLHDLPIQLDSHHYSLFIIHIWKSDLHLNWNYFLKLRKENILSAFPLTKRAHCFLPLLPVLWTKVTADDLKGPIMRWLKDDSRWPTMTYWGLLGVTRVLAPQCDWESKQVDIGCSG